MIFKETHDLMLKRLKGQTRRPVKPGEMLVYATSAKPGAMFSYIQDERFSIPTVIIFRPGRPVWEDDFIRVKWQVGKDYAIQPGRGKPSLGRTPSVEEIRRERLRDISVEDCRAEGITNVLARFAFEQLWNPLYRNTPYEWKRNPEVWVLVFEKEE